jgi:putative ABC transport system permease protein
MLKNYLKIALRNLDRHKLFSFINIFGLALSLSFCLLVIVIINDQNNFDHFHTRSEDIYRLNTEAHRKDGSMEKYASSPYPLGAAVADESPVAEKVVRLTWGLSGEMTYGKTNISLQGFFTEPSFLDVFGFELSAGSAGSSLLLPNSVILTTESAGKIFGKDDPIGETISLTGIGDFIVMGVLEPFPGKTHFDFDLLGSTAALPILEKEKKISPVLTNWNNYYATYTYVRLLPGSHREDLQAVLEKISQKFYSNLELESRDTGYTFEIQPLAKITPGPILSNNLGRGMPEILLNFLSVLALLAMFAATFNYSNLTLARALTRAKEVGVRKVTGASRSHLFFQFLWEAVLIALLALALAEVLLRSFLIPGFRQLHLVQLLEISFTASVKIYLYSLGFAALIGMFAGLLPAIIISAFRPTFVLKDVSKIKIFSKVTLRKALIVVQFALALVLMIVLTTVYRQTSYALRIDYYGFNWQNTINIDLQGNSFQTVSQEMSRIPGVVGYSAASHNMGTWEDSSEDIRLTEDSEPIGVRNYSVDEHFLDNMELMLVAGNNFKEENASTNNRLIIVNERFLEKFKLGKPVEAVGRMLILGKSKEVQISGILKDFLFKPLTYSLEPLFLEYDPATWNVLNLKIYGNDIAGVLANCEKTWKTLDPVHPFRFEFYEDTLRQTYETFQDSVLMIGFLSLLVFTISSLGLLGIATFTAETKIREVGIRKVLGASVYDLVIFQSRHYIMMLMVAAAIAIPISIFISNKILQNFAYRIGIGLAVILPPIVVMFFAIALTVGWQAVRAALRNPVIALRIE